MDRIDPYMVFGIRPSNERSTYSSVTPIVEYRAPPSTIRLSWTKDFEKRYERDKNLDKHLAITKFRTAPLFQALLLTFLILFALGGLLFDGKTSLIKKSIS